MKDYRFKCLLLRLTPGYGFIDLGIVDKITHIARLNFCFKHIKLNIVNSNSVSSVQFSHSVVSYSLRPHGLPYTRPPCPSPTPGVYSNSCPLSQWCHPTILSSVLPFSSCLQSFPTSGSFQMSEWPKYWSYSFNINPSNEYLGLISFRIDWLNLLAVQGLSRVFSNTTV